MIRRKYHVHGKVQGVWFRASTRDQAAALNVSGHVGNLADGSVIVEAQGNADALGKLEQWLQQGPPLAKVIRVDAADLDVQVSETGFHVL